MTTSATVSVINMDYLCEAISKISRPVNSNIFMYGYSNVEIDAGGPLDPECTFDRHGRYQD